MKRKTQRGGHYGFPKEYYTGKSCGNYFEDNHPNLSPKFHANGPGVAVSQGVPTGHGFDNHVGPNLDKYAYKDNCVHQHGGMHENPYLKIVNPATNRKVSIYSAKGKSVLKNYLKQLN